MCVPQPSSNGHSLFGFVLCEHGEDQLLGKKAPIETPSSFVLFLFALVHSCAQQLLHFRIYYPDCLLVWNVYECFTHYICTYVCMCVLHCVHVCIHVWLVPWEPEESIIFSGSGVKDSWAAMLVLELHRVLCKAPFIVWQVGKNKFPKS